MPATVPQLGARALRKLGMSLVATSSAGAAAGGVSAPAPGAVVTAPGLVPRVLLELGIVVPESERPAPQPPLGQAEVAARALRAVGINPASEPLSAQAAATTAPVASATIANLVLLKLAVIASDETASTQDLDDATQKVNAVHGELVQLGIATWQVDAIPQHAVEHYVVMAAERLAAEFGRPSTADVYQQAIQSLGRQVLSGPDGLAISVGYVSTVHDALSGAGLVSWPIGAIPAAVAAEYVTMTAALLAPMVDRGQDAPSRQVTDAEWGSAMERVKQSVLDLGSEARALTRLQQAHEELNALGLVSWDTNNIPPGMADAYVNLAVAAMAPEFGKPFDPKAYEMAMARVRAEAMRGVAGQMLAEAKVRAVHAAMNARRLTRWTLFNLPVEAEEPYVLMAAFLLAPEVEAKADPTWWQAGEMDVCRIAVLPTDRRPVCSAYF